MKIFVKVKTGAREEKMVAVDDKHYLVQVKEHPVDGKANDSLYRVLGKYFNIPPSTVRIVHGEGAREKIIEVPLTRESMDPLGDDIL